MKQTIKYLVVSFLAFLAGILAAPNAYNALEIDPFARTINAEDFQYQTQSNVHFALMNIDGIKNGKLEQTIRRDCKIVRLSLPNIDSSVFPSKKDDVERLIERARITVSELQKINACG